MPERLTIGFSIGGMRRDTAEVGGSRESWQESPGIDWRKAKGHVFGGPGKPTAGLRITGVRPNLPITCEEMGWVEDSKTGRFRIYLLFCGIDLSVARFIKSGDHYLRPEGSDSAVYARLLSPRGILVIGTCGDVLECQFQFSGSQPYSKGLGTFLHKELESYDPRIMGITVKDNLVTVGYPLRQ